ncbi:MAG TPA: hypothetical protein VLF69_01385 [Candidatus Saccharimonadales bacterium]|nr:hypothetical protein [Candidatus Saccharimonadales bacterium]
MTEAALATLGVLSGVLNTLAFVPYIRAIVRGKAKPQRTTFWIWFVVSAVGFFGQQAGGAQWSLVWAFSGLLGTLVVASLSIKYGYGTFHWRDGLSLAVTAVGAVLAVVLHSPLLAVTTAVLIDAVGAGLTVHKTWLAPYTEPLFAWTISLVAALCGVLAVGRWQPAIFLAPLFNLVMNVSMVGLIAYRRPRLAPTDVAVEQK